VEVRRDCRPGRLRAQFSRQNLGLPRCRRTLRARSHDRSHRRHRNVAHADARATGMAPGWNWLFGTCPALAARDRSGRALLQQCRRHGRNSLKEPMSRVPPTRSTIRRYQLSINESGGRAELIAHIASKFSTTARNDYRKPHRSQCSLLLAPADSRQARDFVLAGSGRAQICIPVVHGADQCVAHGGFAGQIYQRSSPVLE
jgi:hypothetical protein